METKPRVLVIEDDVSVREIIRAVLGNEHYDFDEAADYRSAIEKLRTDEFDAITTDYHLPDGNGVAIVRFVKMHRPNVPIIMISASTEAGGDAVRAGVTAFVSKPFTPAALRNLLSNILGTQLPSRASTAH